LLLCSQALRSFARSGSGRPKNGYQNNEPYYHDRSHSRNANYDASIRAGRLLVFFSLLLIGFLIGTRWNWGV
jgi:hypothetical protein